MQQILFEAMLYANMALKHRPKYSLEKRSSILLLKLDVNFKNYKTEINFAYLWVHTTRIFKANKYFMQIELYNKKDSVMLFNRKYK